jgi:hypothetical protein
MNVILILGGGGDKELLEIPDFRRDVDEIWALLGCYAASSGNPLPTFRDIHLQYSRSPMMLLRWTSWHLEMGPIRCPETSIKDYHSTLRNTPEERRSQILERLVWAKAVWMGGWKKLCASEWKTAPLSNVFKCHRTEYCIIVIANTHAGSVNSKFALSGFVPSIPSACHLAIFQKLCPDISRSPYSSLLATRPACLTSPYGTA